MSPLPRSCSGAAATTPGPAGAKTGKGPAAWPSGCSIMRPRRTTRTSTIFFSTAVRGQALDSPANTAFHADILEAFLEDKIFIEAQQEAVGKDPARKLLLRGHDKAVAYSRRAIRKMRETEFAAAAE